MSRKVSYIKGYEQSITHQSSENQVSNHSKNLTEPSRGQKIGRTTRPNRIERCNTHQEQKTECKIPKGTGQQPERAIQLQQLKSSKRRNPSPTAIGKGFREIQQNGPH